MSWIPFDQPPPNPVQKEGAAIIESVPVHILYDDGTHGNGAYFFSHDPPWWYHEAMWEGEETAEALDDGTLKPIAWRYPN